MTTSSKPPFERDTLPPGDSPVGWLLASLRTPGCMTGVVIDVNGELHFS